MRTINLFKTVVKCMEREGEFSWGEVHWVSISFVSLTFLKTADGCMGVAFSVPLSRSEICPNLKKIKGGTGPNIWNFFKGKR